MSGHEDDEQTYVDSRGAEVARISFSDALAEVFALASLNLPDEIDAAFGDDGIPAMARRQAASLRTLEQVLADRGAEIDGLQPSPAAADWPEEDFGDAADLDPFVPSQAVRTCLAMAEQVALDPAEVAGIEEAEEADRQQLAMDVVRDLLGMHSAALDARPAPVASAGR
jgi:hypothetical protein